MEVVIPIIMFSPIQMENLRFFLKEIRVVTIAQAKEAKYLILGMALVSLKMETGQ